MVFKDITSFFCFIGLLILQECGQVLTVFCGADLYCNSPYKCCEDSLQCCLDRNSDNYYSRNFKLHVWNMWYFWFIIIFIMMSCFGGCGYYRRRRLVALHQTSLSPNSSGPTQRHLTCRQFQTGTVGTPAYYAYTGPGAPINQDMTNLPPPYFEVMSQPEMYPSNKAELPPYPGVPVITAENTPPMTLSAGSLPTEVPQPPPYSETTGAPNQRPAEPRAPPNQN